DQAQAPHDWKRDCHLVTEDDATHRFRTLFISDVHLGTRGCQAERLLDFLRHHDADTIYPVGDIIDGWQLRSGWYWPQTHNDVVRRRLGFGYWSLSKWAKLKVKNAVSYIGEFEQTLVDAARRHDVDGVICGHIHLAAIHRDFGIRYVNCGDWVESCTAIAEHP